MDAGTATSSELGPPASESIEEATRNTDAVQQRVLGEILSRNADTEYLRRFGLGGATDRGSFKSKVPVVHYEDLKPEIERIANGDKSKILCSHPISELLTSSGTSSGERKLIPTIHEDMDRRRLFRDMATCVVKLHIPDLDKGKGLHFLFAKAETKTPGGLVAQPALTSFLKSEQFMGRPEDPNRVLTSPIEAILCLDSFQSMYTQVLCGLLARRSILRIGAIFASGLLRAIRFLQLNWRDLARDIASGTLNPRVTDPAIRARMAEILKPDTDLAEFVTAECRDENWEGIITRIWPNTKYLETIVTGAMAPYIPMLDYYSNGLPKVCTAYASSECGFGLNLKPLCDPSEVSYTIMPNMAYFEFMPHGGDDASAAPPRLVEMTDVEVGKEYELVITTYAGLYRYRVGDILRVTGFHNAAPQFRFVRRKNVLLSIDSDKTDEAELQAAVQNASMLLGEFNTNVVEFTSYADTKTIPGHYVIYLELLVRDPSSPPSTEALERCCLAIEESLNAVYRQGRVAENSIGPLEIRVVKTGTFEGLMNYAISRGASIDQYKVPRCVNLASMVQLLNAGVVSAHFSPAAPHWTPERRR